MAKKTDKATLGERAIVIAGCVAGLLVHLPLLFLVYGYHAESGFWSTLRRIALHAPNQFMFLSFLFPFVIYSTCHLWIILLRLSRTFPRDFALSGSWRRIKWFFLPYVLLACALALDDSGFFSREFPGEWRPADASDEKWFLEQRWYPDWYQLDGWNEISEAAVLNQLLVRSDCLVATSEECAENIVGVRNVYGRASSNVVMQLFESIELAVVALVVALTFLGAAIGARIRLARGKALKSYKYSASLRKHVANGVRPVLVMALCFSAFVALRSQNIAEIRLILPGYETVDPRLLLVGNVVLVLFACVMRFGALDTNYRAILESALGFVFAGALALFAWSPAGLAAALHEMRALGNWIIFVFVASFTGYLIVIWVRSPVHWEDDMQEPK